MKKMMKLKLKDSIIWSVILFCLPLIHSQQTSSNNDVYIHNPLDCFLKDICYSIEPDSIYAEQLKNYITNALIVGRQDYPKGSFDELFTRPSFVDCGIILLDNAFADTLSEYGYSKEYILDYRYNYLFYCTNQSALIKIADELLAVGSINGIVGLWINYDISKLSSYNQFIQKSVNENNYWDLLYLLVPIHNINNQIQESRLINIINKLAMNDSEVRQFIEYIKAKNIISFEDFVSYFNDPSFLQ